MLYLISYNSFPKQQLLATRILLFGPKPDQDSFRYPSLRENMSQCFFTTEIRINFSISDPTVKLSIS